MCSYLLCSIFDLSANGRCCRIGIEIKVNIFYNFECNHWINYENNKLLIAFLLGKKTIKRAQFCLIPNLDAFSKQNVIFEVNPHFRSET